MAAGRASQKPSYTKAYISSVAFGEKSTPDYTWNGVFVENKKLETKYLPNDLMNQLKQLSDEVSSMWDRISLARSTANSALTEVRSVRTAVSEVKTTANNAQTTAENAQTIAQSALSMLPTVTSTDSGKFLRVSAEGKWVAEAIASAEGASF